MCFATPNIVHCACTMYIVSCSTSGILASHKLHSAWGKLSGYLEPLQSASHSSTDDILCTIMHKLSGTCNNTIITHYCQPVRECCSCCSECWSEASSTEWPSQREREQFSIMPLTTSKLASFEKDEVTYPSNEVNEIHIYSNYKAKPCI